MSFNASKDKNADIKQSLNNPYQNHYNNQSNNFNQDYKNDSAKMGNTNIKIQEAEETTNNFNNTNKNSEFNYNSHPYNTNRLKNTSLKNFASTSDNLNSNNDSGYLMNKTNYFQDVNLFELHSKVMLEPIIIKEYFIQSIQRELKKNKNATDLIDLKLLDYTLLKQIIESCGSFPEKHRINFYKFLFSLPNDFYYFDLINKRGLHPFFKNLELQFDLKDKFFLNKLKNICSNLAFWSEEVGNVFFLPNLVFPFVKCFKGNDSFLFELLISIINCFCQFWFEFYPGAPLNHLKLCEKIIEKENPHLFKFLKTNEKKEKEKFDKEKFDYKKINFNNRDKKFKDPINLKITEISWKFMQSFYSESLDKTSWMQLIDFLTCNTHRPEMLLYINSALLLVSDKLIIKCKSIEELYTLLFSQNLLKYPISGKNMLKVFNLANNLYNKYSNYQLYKYTPHIPFENGEYKMKINFPLDFLGTTAAIKEQVFQEESKLEQKKNQIEILESNFKELLKREKKIQRTYECLVHKEKEKAELLQRELDLILFQKDKLNQELKEKKLDKVGRLQNVIDQSMHLYKKMNENELKYFNEELKTRKVLEEFDMKSRLQQEELNNLEVEANRKLIDLMHLRTKDEMMQKHKEEEFMKEKERNFANKIHENKWNVEDEAYKLNLINISNNKEMQLLKLRDQNLYMEKLFQQKKKDHENKIFIQQVEQERLGRNGDFNNFGRTSIEDNFLNSISKVSNKNNSSNQNNYNNNRSLKNSGNDAVQQQIENEFNGLIEDLRNNMRNLELEEKALLEYEQDLLQREFDTKLLGLKKSNYSSESFNTGFKGDMNNYIIDELNKIESEKQNCKQKKNDLEKRKQQISDNLSNMYNYNIKTQPSNQYSNSNSSGKNPLIRTSNNNDYLTDSYGNNVLSSNNNNNNNLNINSLNSINSSELHRLEKENQIRQENEKLYKKITNSNTNNNDDLNEIRNSNSNNYSANRLDSENKQSQSEALTSKFPYENSFGDRSPNNLNINNNNNQNTFGDNRNDNNNFNNPNDMNESK